jgi:anti-anti-sigma regulatory factor
MGFWNRLFGGGRQATTATAVGDAAVTDPPRVPDAPDVHSNPYGSSSPAHRPRVTRVEDVGDVAVVSFVDPNAFYGSAAPVHDELHRLTDEFRRRNVVLSFRTIQHFPSYALGRLIALDRKCQALRGKLVLWNVGADALALLRLCKIDRVLTVITTPDHFGAADVVREAFGDPAGPTGLDAAWRTDTVVLLARQMAASGDFGAMPILADALQDAGCDSTALLDHCRGDGPHCHGCWVLDLLLTTQSPVIP